MKTSEQDACRAAKSFPLSFCRRRAIRWLGTCIVSLFVVSNSHADGITFLDGAETLSASTASSRISVSCTSTPEQCIATVLAPQNATFVDQNNGGNILITEQNGMVSDLIQLTYCS